jgi:hypothetical protein
MLNAYQKKIQPSYQPDTIIIRVSAYGRNNNNKIPVIENPMKMK